MAPSNGLAIANSETAIPSKYRATGFHTLDLRQLLIITTALAVLGLLWTWREARGARSARDAYQSLITQTEQMSRDVNLLETLRQVPRLAADRERPNSELLEQIGRSLEHAGLTTDRWLANDPSPPKRLPDTPYKQYETRLTFQDVGLQRLVAMLHHLVDEDATLTVSRLRLAAPVADRKSGWDADLTLSYLVYAPHEASPSLSIERKTP